LPRPAALERRLGHRFADARLLEQALTHASWGAENNERLEFLGDGVLGCAVAEELYARVPGHAEGRLSRLRESLVRQETLVEVAASLGLADHLRLAARQKVTPSVLADGVEALFGAIFLDGGYDAARSAALRAFAALLEQIDPGKSAKDAKSRLQEMMHARRKSLPEYRVVAALGEAHQRSFEVECVLADLGFSTTGSGTSLQRAQQEAARRMLERLER
jgi:ribonuclease-3